jgi:hypothetical protein
VTLRARWATLRDRWESRGALSACASSTTTQTTARVFAKDAQPPSPPTQVFYGVLMQHFDAVTGASPPQLAAADALVPHLYEMAKEVRV